VLNLLIFVSPIFILGSALMALAFYEESHKMTHLEVAICGIVAFALAIMISGYSLFIY